jgi:glycosyltransferase involved in cell wall biosynthesis
VLFVAHSRRPLTAQATRWLLQEIWPLVLRRHPDATLVLAGAGGEEWLHDDPSRNVHVTGRVEDLRPYYRAARIAVAPLRRGAGFKFKVAQALVAGLPAVVTSVGADGFEALGGLEHLAIADDAEAFAEAIATLLDEPDLAGRGHAAAAWASGAFDFEGDLRETMRWYTELAR